MGLGLATAEVSPWPVLSPHALLPRERAREERSADRVHSRTLAPWGTCRLASLWPEDSDLLARPWCPSCTVSLGVQGGGWATSLCQANPEIAVTFHTQLGRARAARPTFAQPSPCRVVGRVILEVASKAGPELFPAAPAGSSDVRPPGPWPAALATSVILLPVRARLTPVACVTGGAAGWGVDPRE